MTEHLVRYQSGEAVAVVNDRTVVLLDLPPTDPLVNRIVDLVTDGAGIEDVLDAMVSSGLKSLASFGAFQVTATGVRMVVRGRVSGSVGALAGLHAEHTMWHDTWQPGETAAALHLDGAADGHELVIDRGAVLAGAIYVGSPQIAEPVAAPSTAPLTPPAPTLAEPAVPPAEAAAQRAPVAEVDAEVDSSVPSEESIGGDAFAHLFGAAQFPPSDAVDAAQPVSPEDPGSADGTPPGDGAVLDPSATMDAPLTMSTDQLPTEPRPSPEPKPATLITGMPWAVDVPQAEPEPQPVRQPPPAPALAVPPAPAPGPTPPPSPPQPVPTSPQPVSARIAPPPVAGEPILEVGSDRTVNRSALTGLPPVVMVVAARCTEGHLSPAYAGSCRVCGGTIPQQQPVEIPRPLLGQLRLSTGGVVSLDRPAILGRNPRIPTGYAGEQPNLVRLSDPDKDVSGQHLEVSLDYWNVMVCDLGSTNGTEVILPGAMPVVLRPNDPVIIEPGTRVVLAGSISFVFEVMP